MSCRISDGVGDGDAPDGGRDGDTDTSWVLLAEGVFTAYEWDFTGDSLCDTAVVSWPRDAYNDPEGSRLPLNEPVRPGDQLRVFARYEAGNDVGSITFAGDTSNPGHQELFLATLNTNLSYPGDSASLEHPYGGTDTLRFYIAVILIDSGRLVCRPNQTDSVRLYYRLEKRR